MPDETDGHCLKVFNSDFPMKDYLCLWYSMRKSINTDGTTGLKSLLILCNSTNLEAHIINNPHTHTHTCDHESFLHLKLSQIIRPSTDVILNLQDMY